MKKKLVQEEILLVTSSALVRQQLGEYNQPLRLDAGWHISPDKLQQHCRNGFFNKWSWNSLIRHTPEKLPVQKLYMSDDMVCVQVCQSGLPIDKYYSVYPYLFMQEQARHFN